LRADGANAGIAALNDEGARLILGDLKERLALEELTCRSALENSMRIFERAFKSTVEPSVSVIERRSPMSVA